MTKLLSAALVACGCWSSLATAHERFYSATFSGADPSASGVASLMLSADHTALSYTIELSGLDLGGQTATTADDVIGLHFHNAPAGSNGPVVFGILGSPTLGGVLNPALTDDGDDLMVDAATGTITGVWETSDTPALTQSFLDLLNADMLYLNVHTEAFRGGATRGQIVPEPASVALLALACGAWLVRRRASATRH